LSNTCEEYAGDGAETNEVRQPWYVPRRQSRILNIYGKVGFVMEKAKKCYLCEAKLDKDAIGLNKKLLDKSISRFMCIDCLASHLDATAEELRTKIEEFKNEGCSLFK
jgi:uncharacterized protein YlaI